MTAGRHPGVSFVVMLGGPGLSGGEILCSQIRRVAKAFGVGKSTIAKHVRLIGQAVQILRDHPMEDQARQELTGLFDGYLQRTTEAERSALTQSGYPVPENSTDFAAGILLPWTKDFLLYDPGPDLARVQCPVLSLIGARDMQVAADENNAAIRDAPVKGGNPRGTA